MMKRILALGAILALLTGCGGGPKVTRSFGDDAAFLASQQYTVVLSDQHGLAQVVVVPAYQGRVMTSTAEGMGGQSFGWINNELIASGRNDPHINAYGGEERFWMGPEGGQHGLFFQPMTPFDCEHWQAPRPLDNEPFDIHEKGNDRVEMRKRFELTNFAATTLHVEVRRTVHLFSALQAWRELGALELANPSLKMVGYESANQVINVGKAPWRKENGLPSIWIVGMFPASPAATAVAGIRADGNPGPKMTSDAPVPADRLVEKNGVVFFRVDGQVRGRIGISPKRTKGVMGCYDPESGTLTVVQFMPIEPAGAYVNSAWKIQEDPYAGDAANIYNAGPVAGGKQLGQFYQLESSSPALELAPGQSKTHISRTYHIRGEAATLDPVARKVLGVSLAEIEGALPKSGK